MRQQIAGFWVELVRSGRRRTIGLEMKGDGRIVLRAPYGVSEARLAAFVESRRSWLCNHLNRIEQEKKNPPAAERLTDEAIRVLTKRAAEEIPKRAAYFAPLVGVTYGRITIRCQKTRWGSCSAQGNLNFNCLLMLAPPQVIDSVVVHELCHRKEMNHSSRFYAEVRRVFPEYDKWNGWLKQNGQALMRRRY